MKSSKHCEQRGGEVGVNLARLVDQLMSLEEASTRVTFDRVKIEGGNVGASMHINRGNRASPSDPGEQPGSPSINIYISNNIQGVSNSILVGSEVKMVDPGLGISLGDVMWERENQRSETSFEMGLRRISPIIWVNAVVVVLCGSVVVLSLLFAHFWPGKGK